MEKMVGAGRWLMVFSLAVMFSAQAQTPVIQNASLAEFTEQVNRYYEQQYKRAQAYAQQHSIPMSYRDRQGNYVVLVGVSDDGRPMYETTDNAGAAITTGVDKLREGGVLGLNLQGEGMEVGIWDGGIVDAHIEFDNRILLREGSTEDNHATHVTGTILASGINVQARGMAPKASAYVYDFSNDTPEMIAAARNGIILSNHSYGLITGWRFNGGWQWSGNSSISTLEDWRFGFYSTAAAQWDQLAFEVPNYLIVKSAGNDRSDTGNGSFPPDCNGGSGYDCVSDKSVAKNILTVGAVQKVPNYVDPSSVVMSSFSSWGPTDDGRIKPDLVAAGVSIFSTYASDTDNTYGPLSGTSMSAPNATGSLVLLQELYKNLNSGAYMRSATLKALAIHSVKEAGPYPGPDYMFGWGLLDVEAGAKIILNEDDQNIIIAEENLLNGQMFELTLQPKANTRIKATLVWTDPAGTPVGASLDPENLMLVNDLDMRIADDAGNEQLPWILSLGELAAPATKGDNFRDNVEKIEFDDPEPRNYKLTVRHKGNLRNNEQAFSLIVEYTSINDPRVAYYWIGNEGEWSNPANWSLSSGGPAAGMIPGADDRVIVDENSFTGSVKTISLSEDAECYSVTWLTKAQSGMALNGNTLTINGPLNISSNAFTVVNPGNLRFTGSAADEVALNLGQGNLVNAELQFDGPAMNWRLLGSPFIGTIHHRQGNLNIQDAQLEVKHFVLTSGLAGRLDLTNSIITGIESFATINTGITLASENTKLVGSTDVPVDFSLNTTSFNGILDFSGSGRIASDGMIQQVNFSGDFNLEGSAQYLHVNVATGSTLHFPAGQITEFGQETEINSSETNRTKLISNSATEQAILQFNGHYKLCFDHLEIIRVNMDGTAVVNAGKASTLEGTDDWLREDCEDVLFPDFDVAYPCVNGFTEFSDKSSGAVTTWSWNFGVAGNSTSSSILQNPNFTFATTGTYDVTLEVGNDRDKRQYTQSIEIVGNPIPANTIILSGLVLFSERAGPEYQWYRDNEPLSNTNLRAYTYDGRAGTYFVVIRENGCSRASTPFIITSLDDEVNVSVNSIQMYPNPASDLLTIEIPPSMVGGEMMMISPQGTILSSHRLSEEKNQIRVGGWPTGLYLVQIRNQQLIYYKKVIIR
jgi:hypothetical protein